jgi:hypothetical protein
MGWEGGSGALLRPRRQFRPLKYKKAPLAPTAGCRCGHPAALKASLKGALEDEVVVDPGADADELALLAALPVPRHGVCAIGGALV